MRFEMNRLGLRQPGDRRRQKEFGNLPVAGLTTEGSNEMAEGTIARLVTDKGFGFIDVGKGKGKDLFFHVSALDGVDFEDLSEGQKVTFTEGEGEKGPRAENVRVVS